MADPSTDDYSQLLINGAGTGAQYGLASQAVGGATAAQQQAYAAILKNLQDRFGDYSNLKTPGYQNLTAPQLGSSALAGIQPDAQARTSEQAAIGQLGDIANRGGLDLSDEAALNNIQANLSQQNSARQQGIANQFAARGQLGSGAQLAMDLASQQNAATNANQAGESAAGQAQQRAMQALLQKAQASRTMGNDDYQRKAQAAQAADAIAKYNAQARTGASQYNNQLQGQAFGDQLAKLQGEGNVTNSLNGALLGQGNVTANGILGQGSLVNGAVGAGAGLVSKLAGVAGKSGGGSSGSGSSGGTTGPTDENGNDPNGIGATAQAVGINPEDQSTDGYETLLDNSDVLE